MLQTCTKCVKITQLFHLGLYYTVWTRLVHVCNTHWVHINRVFPKLTYTLVRNHCVVLHLHVLERVYMTDSFLRVFNTLSFRVYLSASYISFKRSKIVQLDFLLGQGDMSVWHQCSKSSIGYQLSRESNLRCWH